MRPPHSTDPDRSDHPPSQSFLLACQRFVRAWESGQTPQIGDFLNEVEESERSLLRSELAALSSPAGSRSGDPAKGQDNGVPDEQATIARAEARGGHAEPGPSPT